MTWRPTSADIAALLSDVATGTNLETAANRIGVSGATIRRRALTDHDLRARIRAAQASRPSGGYGAGLSHGLASTYNRGCRCDACRAANRDRIACSRRERRGKPVPADVKHGTSSTYCNWGCRCDECCAAHRARMASYYERRKARTAAGAIPESIRHGRLSTYTSWGCRCQQCVRVAQDHRRKASS